MSLKTPETWLTTIAFWILAFIPLLLANTRAGADIALGGIDVLFLARSFLTKDWQWAKKPEMKALGVLWLFMMAVSYATPINHFSAFKAALIWGRFILFYAAARFWILTSAQALKKVGTIGLFTIAWVAVDTFWQYKTGISLTHRPMISERLTGPLTKANIGNYLLKIGFPILGIFSYRLLQNGQPKRLWMPALGVMIVISLILVSGERSTPILLLAGLGIIGLTLFISQPRIRKWVVAAGVAFIALVGLLAATQPIVMDKTHFFVEQMSDFWHTYYGQMYIGAWRLFVQHPITGIGPQQFLEACKPTELGTTYCDVHPHNMYVEWLVATGLPGISLFIFSMALILRRLLTEIRFSGIACIIAACALGEFTMLLFPFVVTQSVFSNWSAVLFWYSLSLGMSLPQLNDEKTP